MADATARAGGARDEPGAGNDPGWDEGTSAAGAWLELAIEADQEAVEAVSEILGRVAGGGTSVEPAFSLVDEGLGAAVDPSRPAIVRGYVPARDRVEARAAVEQTREALGHLRVFDLRPIGELTVRVVHEEDWANAWKQHFPVLRIGERIVIRPTWHRHRRSAGDVVIALDPGMAFGTGLHPTTRLCLAGIEHWADRRLFEASADAESGPRVLDVGCGSGILSIAAGKLGASEVVGLDTDPIAIEASIANARRNALTRRFRPRLGSLPSGAGPFDLVLANLIASVLIDLAPLLRNELRPGGRMLASGIFVDRERDVRAAFDGAGLAIVERSSDGDWVGIDAQRPG